MSDPWSHMPHMGGPDQDAGERIAARGTPPEIVAVLCLPHPETMLDTMFNGVVRAPGKAPPS